MASNAPPPQPAPATAPGPASSAATPPPPHHHAAPPFPRGYSGPSPHAASPTPVQLAPSGIPYGHVPAYLPGSASLVEELDQRIMLVLRDGRHLVGILRSFDQFSNLVLEDASERRICMDRSGGEGVAYYADVPLGLYVVRGDSVVLLGQVASGGPSPSHYGNRLQEVPWEELEKRIAEQEQQDPKPEPLQWDFDTDLVA